jgi:hypothetical protein
MLATWEAKIRRIRVQDHPGQKVCNTTFQSIAGQGACHLSYVVGQGSEADNLRLMIPKQLGMWLKE